LSKYIKRKTKHKKGVTRTEDCLVTSHSTTLVAVLPHCYKKSPEFQIKGSLCCWKRIV